MSNAAIAGVSVAGGLAGAGTGARERDTAEGGGGGGRTRIGVPFSTTTACELDADLPTVHDLPCNNNSVGEGLRLAAVPRKENAFSSKNGAALFAETPLQKIS